MGLFDRQTKDKSGGGSEQQEESSASSEDEVHTRLRALEKQAATLAIQLKESERVRELLVADNRRIVSDARIGENKAKVVREELISLRQSYAQSQETLADKRLAMSELKEALNHKQEALDDLLRNLANAPVMTEQTHRLMALQQDILDNLQSTLVCAMCFESIGKGQIISLACGHVFCEPCINRWSVASVSNQMASLPDHLKGPIRAECPECRGDASKSGRIKVFVLEEIVRVLARYDPASILEAPQPSTDQEMVE